MTGPHDRDATMTALRRALPYIRLYQGRVFVIKAGGAGCHDPSVLRELADEISVLRAFGIRVVLVHGGGPQTTALSQRLGVETQFLEGRRVTCEKTLDVAIMTMNGSVNTQILAACRGANLPAIGVSGVDAGLVRARRRPARTKTSGDHQTTVDYGHVGDIVTVDVTVLNRLLDAGFVPVVSPISADDAGNLLNINADTVAATIARQMGAEKLIFLTDAAGILEDRNDPASLVSYTDVRGLNALLERGALDAGMIPKANAMTEALYGGVKRVHVVNDRTRDALLLEIFTNEGAGTLIVMDTRELLPAEQAAATHVDAILKASDMQASGAAS